MGWPYERPDIHVSTTLTRRDQAYRAAQRHFIFLPAGPKLVTRTNMVILYPAYRNWEGLLMYQLFVRVQRWRPIPLRQLFYPVFVIPRCSARIGTDVWTHAGLAYVPACHRESFCVVPDCHKLEWIVLPMLPTGTQLPDKQTQVKMRTFQPFGLYLLASMWSEEIWIGQHVTFT